jgi:hypothetical protein
MLSVDLIPRSSWGENVRSKFSPSRWDELRRKAYAAAGYRCEVCGGVGPRHPVECHEVWSFDEASGVQRLERLIALCPACHEVKHIGLATMRGHRDRAMRHLAEVNGWSLRQAEDHVSEQFKVWRRRSGMGWSVDVSSL